MPNTFDVRQYSTSDAALKQDADQCIVSITRDIADFNTRGVTQSTLTAFEDLINTFDNLPTDEELIGEQTTATEAKDALAEKMRSQIRSIRGIAADVYKGKGRYRSFGFEGMEAMNDDKLYRLGGRVVRVGTSLQPELEAAGLTTAVLTSLSTLTAQFDRAIDACDAAFEKRNISAHTRVVAGNAVYTELVRLCNIGKYLYQDTDPARYNDYVITEGAASAPPAAPADPAA